MSLLMPQVDEGEGVPLISQGSGKSLNSILLGPLLQNSTHVLWLQYVLTRSDTQLN
jgi:hypothetical protein